MFKYLFKQKKQIIYKYFDIISKYLFKQSYINLSKVLIKNNFIVSLNNKIINNFINSENLDYYLSDFFCKNSKIMGLCSSKIKFFNLNIL